MTFLLPILLTVIPVTFCVTWVLALRYFRQVLDEHIEVAERWQEPTAVHMLHRVRREISRGI